MKEESIELAKDKQILDFLEKSFFRLSYQNFYGNKTWYVEYCRSLPYDFVEWTTYTEGKSIREAVTKAIERRNR